MTERMKELETLMTSELQRMARYVNDHIPDQWAFCVLLCETGHEDGTVLYVSNADRVQMVDIIEKWIADMRADNYRLPDPDELDMSRS